LGGKPPKRGLKQPKWGLNLQKMGGERHTHKKKLRSEHGGVKSGNMGISGWVYAVYKKQNTIDLGFDPDCRSSQHMEDVYKSVHIVHLEAN
jgi:hypothetical protein